MTRHLLLALTAGLLVAADEPKKPDTPVTKDALQGAWAVVSAERKGMKDEAPPASQLVFAGDAFTLKVGERVIKGTFTLDAAKTPAEIDMKVEEGSDRLKGKVSKGIVAIEADTLKWCNNQPGIEDRPKEFSTKDSETHLLITVKREKK